MSKPLRSDRRAKPATGAKPARHKVLASKPIVKPAPVKAAPKLTAKPVPRPALNGTNGKHTPAKPVAKPTPAVPTKPAAKPAPKAVPAPVAAKAIPTPAKPTGKPVAPTAAKATAPAAKASAPKLPIPSTPRPEPVISPDKDLASKVARAGGTVKDQIVLTVPDPFWLHAYWQLSVQSVQRAEAALGQEWHGAKPILRLFDVTSTDTTSTSEAPIRDIVIHGGCSHWYIDVPQPPRSYRIDIGYITRSGRFFPMSRSNVVQPPKAGTSEAIDENWANNVDDNKGSTTERLIASAMASEASSRETTEERFSRGGKETPTFGSGAVLPGKLKKFFFDIDAHLIVTGQTDPTAAVTLQNEGVKLRPDGTFTMRFSLPDSRQIIPAVATSADGMEEQTIVLAVERNTKRLDPMIHDLYSDS